jgi:hypothetical protein
MADYPLQTSRKQTTISNRRFRPVFGPALSDVVPPLADCQRGRLFAQQLAKFFLFFLPADE